jgi:lysyl-tRNA synthetase class 2
VTAEEGPEHERVRREKLARLVAAGVDPYPVGYPRTAMAADLHAQFDALGPDAGTGHVVGVAGRVMLSRIGGGLCFATLRDGSGDIQVMISREGVGEEALAAWKADVDLGDHVGVTGEVMTSRRGELSVFARSWQITSKALRPLPDKHHGLTDPETRVRQRYVDLLVRPGARQVLEWRSAAVWSLRSTLREQGFVEVETPMLQPLHGGANARPFVTHMNAFDMDLFLRIAPELYLKRLVVGGIEKVFEINRNFRNEGVDATHNSEFTMLEAYEAYGDYDTMAASVRGWVQSTAGDLAGLGAEPVVDLSGSWRSVTLHDAVSEVLGEKVDSATPAAVMSAHAGRVGVAVEPEWSAGRIALELYDRLVEHTLREPTFVRDFPVETAPLTRVHRCDPRLAEKWDLVVNGTELGTAYSELVDPLEQRARLTAQSLKAAGGDPDAMQLDVDFLRALETGMPPSGGMGMGIDRLLMVLTGVATIRETTLFPLVRPE